MKQGDEHREQHASLPRNFNGLSERRAEYHKLSAVGLVVLTVIIQAGEG